MAYEEYLDLYLLAQNNHNALYYVVSFDIINSKSLDPKKGTVLVYNIEEIMKYVYNKLLEKEKELNRPVVIKDERFYRPWDRSVYRLNADFNDPYIAGDNFQFTVLRDTIAKKEIIEWVYECKDNLNMKEEFHIADGYYETNEYGEGNNKFYRGYCLKTLAELHKPQIQEELQKVKKRIKQ